MKKSCFISNNLEIDKLFKIQPISIKYATNLENFFNKVKSQKIKEFYNKIYCDYGIVLPRITFTADDSFKRDYYEIQIREEAYISSFVNFTCTSEDNDHKDNKSSLIFWIEEDNNKQGLDEIGIYKIISELNTAIFENIEKIINIKYISELINHTEKHNPFLVEDLKTYNISKMLIKKVLINLIKSEISIKDFEDLTEKIIEIYELGYTAEHIPEIIRSLYIKKVIEKQSHSSNTITALKLSSRAESILINSNKDGDIENEIEHLKDDKSKYINALLNIFNDCAEKLGHYPILICHNSNRSTIQQLINTQSRNLQIYSNKEVINNKNIKILQVIRSKDININNDYSSDNMSICNTSNKIRFRNKNYKVSEILQLNTCYEKYKESIRIHTQESQLSGDKMKKYISKLTDLSVENIILELQDKCIPTKYIIKIVEDLEITYISFINEMSPIENINDFMITAEKLVLEIKKRYKQNIEITCQQILLEKIYLNS